MGTLYGNAVGTVDISGACGYSDGIVSVLVNMPVYGFCTGAKLAVETAD